MENGARAYNTSSVTDMLTELNWRTLEQQRVGITPTTLFLKKKITRDLISVDTKEILRPVQRITRHAHPETFIPLQTSQVPSAIPFFREH